MLREPSVSWLPYFGSSPGAWTIFTRLQSASSSSASTIGRLVREPVPISERWATMVTVPSGAIETNTCGSVTMPFGMSRAAGLIRLEGQRAVEGHQLHGDDEARPRHGPLEEAAPADVLEKHALARGPGGRRELLIQVLQHRIMLPSQPGGPPRRSAGSIRSGRCSPPSPRRFRRPRASCCLRAGPTPA